MEIVLVVIFVAAYLLISLEHPLKIDKSAIALLSACALWIVVAFYGLLGNEIYHILGEHLSPIAEIIIFLMGAMTIVEVIDGHQGFGIITERIKTKKRRTLLVIIGCTTFILSAMLDNLATTIVMIAVMLKFISGAKERVIFTGIIVIAANAGGAFSPIGDITTTMMWIGGQISPGTVISRLFLPSLVAFLVPLLLALPTVRGTIEVRPELVTPVVPQGTYGVRQWERVLVFVVGIGSLVSVPIFKIATGLPPFMGVLGALGILWVLTEILQRKRSPEKQMHLTVSKALGDIDMPSILFFVGILLSVAALEVSGVLHHLSEWLESYVSDKHVVALSLGVLSAVFDNVPLIAASMQMYPLERVPADASFWHFLAYTAGTGGSMLIIGSAAGVTAMGSAKIKFGTYALRVGPLAALGYLAGAGTYLIQKAVFNYV